MSKITDKRYRFLAKHGYHDDDPFTYYVVKECGGTAVSVIQTDCGYRVEANYFPNVHAAHPHAHAAHPHAHVGLRHNYTRKQLLAELPGIERMAAKFGHWCRRQLAQYRHGDCDE